VCIFQGGGIGLHNNHCTNTHIHGHSHAHTLDGSSHSYYSSNLPRVTRDIIMDNNRVALPSYDLSDAHEVHSLHTYSIWHGYIK
jgi:hypothetical protein